MCLMNWYHRRTVGMSRSSKQNNYHWRLSQSTLSIERRPVFIKQILTLPGRDDQTYNFGGGFIKQNDIFLWGCTVQMNLRLNRPRIRTYRKWISPLVEANMGGWSGREWAVEVRVVVGILIPKQDNSCVDVWCTKTSLSSGVVLFTRWSLNGPRDKTEDVMYLWTESRYIRPT